MISSSNRLFYNIYNYLLRTKKKQLFQRLIKYISHQVFITLFMDGYKIGHYSLVITQLKF